MSDNTIAQGYVQILPTTKGISANLSKSLNGSIGNVGDEAGESIGDNISSGISSKMKIVGATMAKSGAVMTAAGAGLIAIGKQALAAAEVQSTAEAKLTEVYKTRLGVSADVAQETMNLASSLQEVGVIGDEVALSGAQQLATFAKYPDTVNTLLPAMENLLAQQKGLNATSSDATSIANLMGKAMNGSTSALTRVGISFSDAQAEILKTGNEEERAAVLAEVITDNVGNMNEALAQTDAGKIQQAKNAMGDLSEQVGTALAPHVASLASYVGDKLLPKVSALLSFVEAHPVIAKTAVGITAFLAVGGPLLITLGGIISAAGVLAGVLGTMALPVLGITAAVIAAIVAGVLLYKNWDKIKAKAAAFKTSLTANFNSLKASTTRTFNSVRDAITKPIDSAHTKVRNGINKIKSIINGAKLKLPHFDLPHFRIYGGKIPWGIGGKGTKPTVDIDWYANGAIFTKPTLLGGNSGVGEAGAEAALPLSVLWTQIDRFAETLVNGFQTAQMASASGGSLTVIMQLDGRTIGQSTVDYINGQTIQFGTNPIAV